MNDEDIAAKRQRMIDDWILAVQMGYYPNGASYNTRANGSQHAISTYDMSPYE